MTTTRDHATNWTGSPLATAGAFSLAVGGFVHLCLYRHGYRALPHIGTLFAVNVLASAAAPAALLVRRDLIVRLTGLTVAGGTLGAFAVSRTGAGLLHFHEVGLLPSPQAAVTLAAESLAFVVLGATIIWDMSQRASRWLGAAALVGVAAVHGFDLRAQLAGPLYISIGYVLVIGTSIVLAVRLVRAPTTRDWGRAAAVATVAIVAYVLSRSVGLPHDTHDIGNWAEPLGIAALVTEATVVLIATALRSPKPVTQLR